MRPRLRPLLSNAAAAIAGVALALLAAEGAARILWRTAPASAAPDDLPIRQVRDPEILYRLIPGSSGLYGGTRIQVNAMGLRDRDYAIPPPAETRRIVVLGDSMVFGVGLRPEDTLPARLGRALSPTEVVNAGVFGYNLAQEISLLRDVALQYRPGLVISCFVHNDIENWGLGDGGAVPEIKSSRFDPPPRDVWSARLADLMLPDTFDPERLNLLPRPSDRPGLRRRLASASRLYLFVYLRLRTHGWNLTGGERRDPLVGSPTCQAEDLIWRPLREKYRALKGLTESSGARLFVVIQGGLLWEGRPLARLRDLLSEEGIPALDLTPVWGDASHYAREYSLGWDPHPNARANAIAAELVAAQLRMAGLASAGAGESGYPAGRAAPHDAIAARPDLGRRLAEWRAREERLISEEETAWVRQSGGFSAAVDFEGGPKAVDPAQIPYGFWEAGPAAPASGQASRDKGGGRWMSTRASVLLKPPSGASRLTIDLDLPAARQALDQTPATLHVTLGAPPGRCGVLGLDLPVVRGAPGSAVRLEAGLPPELREAGVVEVGLWVDRSFAATYLNPATRDPRMVSFRIRRIALQ